MHELHAKFTADFDDEHSFVSDNLPGMIGEKEICPPEIIPVSANESENHSDTCPTNLGIPESEYSQENSRRSKGYVPRRLLALYPQRKHRNMWPAREKFKRAEEENVPGPSSPEVPEDDIQPLPFRQSSSGNTRHLSENQVLNQIDDDDNDHEDSTSMETAPYSPIPVRQTITAAVHTGETPPVQSARRCQEPVARMLNQVLDTLFIYPHHHQTCQMEHQSCQ
ncbi:Hypothetical predicted protein [Mytilus galloprovincialis]|uniref:Uncharacterized protein n=1 Tax=Mytilus galloprovincialis TaxID=29158 RepID=A0A8B6HFF9_MYTGA|nr:Hypothetical predicted protein [Mytilus galloprovincialis]